MPYFNDKYSCKIKEAVEAIKKSVPHLSALEIQFGIGLESLGHMIWKLLKRNA